MKDYLQSSFSSILWLYLLGLSALSNGVNGIKGPTINVGDELVLYSSKSSVKPLEITCTGDQPLHWNGFSKEDPNEEYHNNFMWQEEDYYTINKTQVSSGYSSTFTIAKPKYMDIGNYTCTQETGESFTTYVYIFDNSTGFLNGGYRGNLQVFMGGTIILDCRTTHPDITVRVFKNNNEEVTKEFEVDKYNIFKKTATSVQEGGIYFCKGTALNFEDETSYIIDVKINPNVSSPLIEEHYNSHHIVGMNFILNCSVPTYGHKVMLHWNRPNKYAEVRIITSYDIIKKELASALVIINASLKDTGNYTCTSWLGEKNKTHSKHIVVGESLDPFVEIQNDHQRSTVAILEQHYLYWIVQFRAFPNNLTHYFLGPSNTRLTDNSERVTTKFNYTIGEARLRIDNITVQDFGKYSFILETWNGKSDNASIFVFINATPKFEFTNISETFLPNVPITLNASILSYNYNHDNNSLPLIDCYFNNNCHGRINMCEDPNNGILIPNVTVSQLGTGLTNKFSSSITFEPESSGQIRCIVSNNFGSNTSDADIILTDIGDTFKFNVTSRHNIKFLPQNRILLVQGDDIKITCAALKFLYTNGSLEIKSDNSFVANCSTHLSEGYCTKFSFAPLDLHGTKSCTFISRKYNKIETKYLDIEVQPTVIPRLLENSSVSTNGEIITVKAIKPFKIFCLVEGTPFPEITWYKDGISKPFQEEDAKLLNNNQVLRFRVAKKVHEGTYRCSVKNRAGEFSAKVSVEVETGFDPSILATIIICLIIVVALGCFIIFLMLRVKREKRLRLELRVNQLYLFNEGKVGNINPDCTVDEQADLLPYDKRFEVDREAIIIGKVLGSGAFGRVMEAKVQCLEVDKKSTRVAVKMCKDQTDISQLQTLTLELKIMIHLGKHLNIVNLMGAMTANLDKGELWILVEYCRYGNMLRFLQKNKSRFVNQIDPDTGDIDIDRMSTITKDNTAPTHRSRGSCDSKVSSFNYGRMLSVSSNPDSTNSSTSRPGFYAGNANYVTADFNDLSSQDTAKNSQSSPTSTNGSKNHYVTGSHFFPTTNPSPTKHNRSDSALSFDESYHKTLATDMTVISAPAPLSPGNSDAGEFSFETSDLGWIPGISGPITTMDLICWMWQVANGMEYLARRKVLHGDLAARNILIAENNVIKISDFGLSRDIYKNDVYKKEGDGNMPVKWMSPEAINQKIFSTQSDIWAYGITMWEIFTLGNTPYPGIPLDPNFTRRLQDGERMEKPEFANEELYGVMLECWDASPMKRPTFPALCDALSSMLAPERKENYVAMNEVYINENAEVMRSKEDFFNIMSSPDFENFQPAEDKLDGSYIRMEGTTSNSNVCQETAGYLDMKSVRNTSTSPNSPSVFSPRPNNMELGTGEHICNFTGDEISSSTDQGYPVETSQLIKKVEVQTEQQPNIESLNLLPENNDPHTPTSIQMSNNNNTKDSTYPTYNNLELVTMKNLSNSNSNTLKQANREETAQINDDHLDAYYINIKNVENSTNNYCNIAATPNANIFISNIV